MMIVLVGMSRRTGTGKKRRRSSMVERIGILTGRLSAAERNEIEKFADLGKTPGWIANKLNRHPCAVNNAMISVGLRACKPRKFSYVRNGRTVRSFNPEEDALIDNMRTARCTLRDIAEACAERFGYRRTPETIGMRLKALSAADLLMGRSP
jgi:hypothetical protein